MAPSCNWKCQEDKQPARFLNIFHLVSSWTIYLLKLSFYRELFLNKWMQRKIMSTTTNCVILSTIWIHYQSSYFNHIYVTKQELYIGNLSVLFGTSTWAAKLQQAAKDEVATYRNLCKPFRQTRVSTGHKLELNLPNLPLVFPFSSSIPVTDAKDSHHVKLNTGST